MNCHKCSSEKDLSLKRALKSGHMIFECKACRRMEYYARKTKGLVKTPREISLTKVDRNWVQRAKEKNLSIINKYKDNAFLEARGLL